MVIPSFVLYFPGPPAGYTQTDSPSALSRKLIFYSFFLAFPFFPPSGCQVVQGGKYTGLFTKSLPSLTH